MVVALTGDLDDEAALDLMESMDSRARDFRPAWRRIVADFVALERRQFATAGALTGGWDPLTPEYAAWKAEHYPGQPIMRRTDELFSSLVAGPQVREESGRSLRLGSAVAHARHASRRRPIIPPIPASTRDAWGESLARWVAEGRA